MIWQEKPDIARRLFEQSIHTGDKIYAPCNMAHMISPNDPEIAKEMYLDTLSYSNEGEAKIGLYLLLEKDDQKQANKYLAEAIEQPEFKEALLFMANYYETAHEEFAIRLHQIGAEQGIDESIAWLKEHEDSKESTKTVQDNNGKSISKDNLPIEKKPSLFERIKKLF